LANGRLGPDDYPNVNFGGSVQTWGLCKELAKRGNDVCIIRRSISEKEESVEKVRLIGVRFWGLENVLPIGGLFFHVFLFFSKFFFSLKSRSIIQRIDPDVICFMDRQTATFATTSNAKKLFVIHSPEAMDFVKPYEIKNSKLNIVLFRINKILQDRIIRKSDYIVVLNTQVEAYLRKKGLSRVAKISNAISLDEASSEVDDGFILYAGRFDWNKNVYSLAKSFSEIHCNLGNQNLYLVGEGVEKEKIRQLIDENGLQSRMTILPWVCRKRLLLLMRKCSFLVLPSFFEAGGPPVVVLEAMASGKPVIARANMGTIDIIVHGKNGYLYKNDAELKGYMEKLFSSSCLRKTIGLNARNTVETSYTFSKIADKYEELFLKL